MVNAVRTRDNETTINRRDKNTREKKIDFLFRELDLVIKNAECVGFRPYKD